MIIAEAIKRKLREKLTPMMLETRDESFLHRGHSGFKPDGESHFRLTIVSHEFTGMTKIQRQRLVHSILKEELEKIHCLTFTAYTYEEYEAVKKDLKSSPNSNEEISQI